MVQKNSSFHGLSKFYREKSLTLDVLKKSAKSNVMKNVIEKAENLSKFSDPILLIGETGVGKNMLAQAIHNEKGRKTFCEVTCTAISERLFESELFGHKKGAFTGANKDHDGLAKKANGGTLFLDEIGEIPLLLQVKLLRLVEQKCFYAVGSDEEVNVDIDIICGTNKKLEDLRNPEIFRSDLFYRMPVYIRIPPLRERPEDLESLIGHFLKLYKGETGKTKLIMEEVTLNLLKSYSWPGNIRELKFVIKSAVIFASKEIKPRHLPEWLFSGGTNALTLEVIEKTHILHVLDLTRGNKSKACKILGISDDTLRRKLKKYEQ